jgi:hypothetical protein
VERVRHKQRAAERAHIARDGRSERPSQLRSLPQPRGTDRWKKLYRQRGAVERENGRLKHEWGLLPLRVRCRERVQLHADLTILARLACALAKARAT